MKEWKSYKLSQISSFRTGKLDSNASCINGKYPFFTCSPETLRIDDFAFDQKAVLLAGNNAEGNFSVKYYEGRFNAYQRTYVFTADESLVNPYFLYYALKICLQDFKQMSQGTSTKFLTAKILNSFEVQLPSLEVQNQIVNILKSIDNKIDINNRINHNLEEQSQALYKSWFVDFEPFKDGEFMDSELGMIPKGWRVIRFSEFTQLSTERVQEEGTPEFSVTNNGIFPRDVKFNKQLGSSPLKNKVIRNGYLVFGMSREILNWGIMKELIGGVSSAYTVYNVNEALVSPEYLEFFIKNHTSYFKDLIKPAAREGQGIDKKILASKCVVLPESEVWKQFRLVLDVLNREKLHRDRELAELSRYRDELLPALMNGQLTY